LYNIGNIELDRFNKLYDNRLKHLQYETDQVSRQINMTIKEKEMSDQKIKIMEHEAFQLHKTVDDKNKNFNELNTQLSTQLNECQNILSDKDVIFHESEIFKTTSHFQLINVRYELNKKEFEQLNHND